MRTAPGHMEAIWRSGDYTGDQRPMARVTVQRPRMALRHYSVMSTFRKVPPAPSGTPGVGAIFGSIDPNHGEKVSQTYADFFFSPLYNPRELTNIRSVTWNRSLDQDFATLTLEVYNTAPRSETDPSPFPVLATQRDLDRPGWYTYDRGKSPFSKRWGHTKNEWRGLLMPDNLIRTYEGYGFTTSRPPEFDRKLMQTGVWIIDTVVVNALGIIVVNCRDVGRLLLDHQVNEPVVPGDFDPLDFAPWDQTVQGIPARTRVKLRANDHSNRYGPIKGADGALHPVVEEWNYRGHRIEDALDDNPATYWMSVGHVKPRWPWGVEWIEFSGNPTAAMASLQMWTIASGYTCYVSLYVDGHWLNKDGHPASDDDPHIRWSANPTNPDRDQHAVRPYVKSFTVGPDFRKRLTTVTLPKTYPKVEKIRLSFVNLQHLPGVGPSREYRVGIRSVRVFGPETSGEVSLRKGPVGANPGRYGDYSDIVKLMCAWAGFFWPPNGLQRATTGQTWAPYYTHGDWDLAVNGRVWGDFEETGTTGPAEFTADSMENRSLMDVVTMVRNIIGYLFLIDEIGSCQWRMPNIYKAGNWINDAHMNPTRTAKIPVIDEKQVLLSLDSTTNSGSIREIIRVSNYIKKVDARGFVPNDVGLRRVLTWNEPKFKDSDVQRAADMVGVRSLFTWRRDRIVIPGFPGFQLDDQVQIFERVASEGFVHYINGISSSNNLETGEWTYTLETHWLGDRTQDVWAIYPDDIPASHLRNLTRRPVRPGFKRDTSGEDDE